MKEEEIRPEKLFDEYHRLAEIDAKLFFSEIERRHINCPACQKKGRFVFNKHGFDYEECDSCLTVYVNPRPPSEAFYKYYRESKSAKFFGTDFYKITANSRREKIWKPRVKMVEEKRKVFCKKAMKIIDIGGGYGIFAEEYMAKYKLPVEVVEPSPVLATVLREKKIIVHEKFIEECVSKDFGIDNKVFVSFELFEHLHDCKIFLQKLACSMIRDDLLIITTLSGTGLDIMELGKESKSVSLQHLNFFNPKSIKILCQEVGLKVVEVITPGKLDMDILLKNKSKVASKFIKYVLENANENSLDEWQNFLVSQKLSSHMQVVLQK